MLQVTPNNRIAAVAKPKARRVQQAPRAAHTPDLYLVQPEQRRFTPPPPLRPLTSGQRSLLSSLRANTLTLSSGSAGTGKTYVALANAAERLKNHEIDRIILTRPLVGVDREDEKIGALPGDVSQKLQFWAMAMLDVLEERLGKTFLHYLLDNDKIVVAPMAYLRGTSFPDSYIHCTEAQNSSVAQIKMLLTRVGPNSTICIEGDPLQSDLHRANGLDDAIERLSDMKGVGVVRFTREDVVRSGFCQQVLECYE